MHFASMFALFEVLWTHLEVAEAMKYVRCLYGSATLQEALCILKMAVAQVVLTVLVPLTSDGSCPACSLQTNHRPLNSTLLTIKLACSYLQA